MSAHGRPITSYERLQRHFTLAWYPISVSLVMFGMFSTFGLAAGQVQEALANYVGNRNEPWSEFAWARAGITFLAIFAFAATNRYWTARLLGIELRGQHVAGVFNGWQRTFVGVAWFAPWFGAALSFTDAALPFIGAQAEASRTFGQDFLHLAGALVSDPLQTPFTAMAAASTVFPFVYILFWWSPLARAFSRRFGDTLLARATHGWMLPGMFLGFAGIFYAMPAWGLDFARLIGPVPLIALSFAVVTAAGSWLIDFGRRYGLPAFPLAAVTPLIIGVIGMDDNHFMRTLAPIEDLQRPTLDESLRAFSRDSGADPIILVSVEGGGVRSAHFAAAVLGRLADQCPRLARRIFAISAVSGGAVGAAAYRASLDVLPLEGEGCALDEEAAPGPRQIALDAMFRRDHLSPSLAKQMFPELIQAFVPASTTESDTAFFAQTDRQRGLELSLEDAFADAFDVDRQHNAFTASAFGELGRPRAAPHLLVNMTETSSGGVYVASDLDLANVRGRQRWLHDFRCIWSPAPSNELIEPSCNQSPDFRLSTIAASSARFPLVSPVGSVRTNDSTFRFVDGGYFDNSGAETLIGVVEHLQRTARERGQRMPRIAVLHIDSNPYQQRLPVKWRLDFDIHELQAVLATREERVRISLGRLYNMHQDGRFCSLRFVEVADNNVPLRLGWILSEPAAEELEDQAASQLATAFPNTMICDGSQSDELHLANDLYVERLATASLGNPR
ncbi:MAG TPA: patatin-like phospholipase family protein [Candidatus Binatia bacterium]|nr:patatin-like phospholipase family protein [Candidatus Binatia bacterium]